MSQETKLQPADNLTPEEFLLETMSTLSPEIKKIIDILLGKLRRANKKIEILQKQLDLAIGKAPIAKNFNPHTTHGMTGTRIYKNWANIKSRCFNSNDNDYPRYGGRGITIYPVWINDFQAFYDYVSTLENYHKPDYTLDRINNDGNYEPGNLKWSTRKEQNRNTRRNIIVEYQGQKMTLVEAAEKSGMPYDLLRGRLRRGVDNLFAPSQKHKKK